MLAILALAPGFASKPLPLAQVAQDRKEITCADVLAAGFCEFDASHVCAKTAGFNGIPTAAVEDECCSGCASDEICMGGTPG